VGFDSMRKRFVDLEEEVVANYFKLYPWEWMWHEEFACHLKLEACRFLEPMWKMLLANKGLLPVLWEKYPGHPNLLPAYFTKEEFARAQPSAPDSYVEKPRLSREGGNVTIVERGQSVAATTGDYGEEGYIYQALAPLADFDGNHPVMGVWIINHEACGLGIREDGARITGNLSRFVPHLF
jgi:glutathionylspermidine synthase